MISCKEVSQLVSQSVDSELSIGRRMMLWVHLSMCRLCYGYRKDVLYLHKATGECQTGLEEDGVDADAKLPDEVRQRMKRVLQDEHPG